MNNYHRLRRKSPYLDTLGRRAVDQMSISWKNTFMVAGGVASALLAAAIAVASDSNHVPFGAMPFGVSIAIEDIRTRELERIMRMDENEDGKVTFEEFRAHRHVAGSLPNFDEMEVEEITQWSETLADKAVRRAIIKKTGDDWAHMRVSRRAPYDWRGKRELFMDMRSDWFDLADADGNGTLDRAEVDSASERIRNHRFQRGFDRLDLNKDEVLDKVDVDLRVSKLTAFDNDGDGELSRPELRDVMRLLRPGSVVREIPPRAIRMHREYDRRSH